MSLAFLLIAMLAPSPSPSPGPSPTAPPSPAAARSSATTPPRDVKIERLQWSRSVEGPEPITAIEVHNDFGDIRARRAGDRVLDASMVVQRLDPGPQGVGFTVERRGPVVSLVVGYPPGRIRDSDPRPPKDSYDRLDLVVFVPSGVTLRARTLRGLVEARGLQSDVEAATLDGRILVAASGAIQARTSGGEIAATIVGRALEAPGTPFLFQSGSGAVTLYLPASANADLRIDTGGEVAASAVPLRRQGDGGRMRATALLGRGERLVLVRSESGRVTVERP